MAGSFYRGGLMEKRFTQNGGMPYVYIITNRCKGHSREGWQYVGSTCAKNPNYITGGTLIKEDIKELGLGSFTKELLEVCELDEMHDKETAWILDKNTCAEVGYNLTRTGKGGLTREQMSPEHRAKWYAKVCAAARKRRGKSPVRRDGTPRRRGGGFPKGGTRHDMVAENNPRWRDISTQTILDKLVEVGTIKGVSRMLGFAQSGIRYRLEKAGYELIKEGESRATRITGYKKVAENRREKNE